ncbi:hypothetical protein KFL_003120135 [Klebsormidium nitens]|uniref:Replication origin-binding protein domain-containing protein n=1 Tax=Klebsormidium nitens TaxID=105231 RepID=A0A1Y1IDK8_KLENI|nr:hypothetical protein KFL_003120135 [Klebsormidium nitens]|eukprot:GAQ86807.1 hypothetical protein KFL_003120135 [Klebsormidium nitens]
MLPCRASDIGQSVVDLGDSLPLAGRFEEGHDEAVPLSSALYACPKPMASEVASTSDEEVLCQVAAAPAYSGCDTLRATSCVDDCRTADLLVVEDALMDDASSQPTECFAALKEECEAPAKTIFAAIMNLAVSQGAPFNLDEWGQLWCFKLAPVLAAFEKHAGPCPGAFIAARDAGGNKGAKGFTVFLSAMEFETYVAGVQAAGLTPSLYEVLLSSEASWLYLDLDYTSSSEVPGDFDERCEHLHRLLEHFCTHVLKLPPGQLGAPQIAASPGVVGVQGHFKSSVHEVFKGVYFENLEARGEFQKALLHFLDHPSANLAFSAEFVRYTKPGSEVIDKIWDDSVYSSNRNWRTLGSCKLHDPRILCSEEGSSERASDHFIGIRGGSELSGALQVDVDLLRAYNAAAGVAGKSGLRQRQVPARRKCPDDDLERDEPMQRDLGPEERARLLECAQADHPGATLGAEKQTRPGVFTVKICAPPGSRTCCLAGREHGSEGNRQYLLYRRANPGEVFYRCFAPSCQGQKNERLLSLRATDFGWSEDYSLSTGMRPYPTMEIRPDLLQTMLVKANKGIGKSKAGTTFLVDMLRKNPSATCVVIASNVALADKHREELHRAGLTDFVLYSDVEGPIKDRRVVVCINSVPRLSSLRKDIVYMDEIDMTLSNLNSDVMKDRRMVFMALHALVEEARVVVGLDANVDSARVLEWVQSIRPEAAMHAIRNSGVRPSKRTVTIRPLPFGFKGGDRFAPVIDWILEKVDAGENVWVASASRSFIEQLEQEFRLRFADTGKSILTFHGGKTASGEKEQLRQAVADPDNRMVAHCLGYSPTVGPGVSIEVKHYHRGVGIALNRPNDGPDVFTFQQMLQRVRDGGDIDIFYLETPPPKFVPTTKEAVFRTIERQDAQLHALVKPSEVLDFMQGRGMHAVCDRTSPTCIVYANNVLARYRSMTDYVELLTEDLEKQGLSVVHRLGEVEREEDEHRLPARQGPDASENPDARLSDEEWRKKFCISPEQNREILSKREALEGLSDLEEKQREVYFYANEVYGVDYNRVNRAFFADFCDEEKKHMYLNYKRFLRTSSFEELQGRFESSMSYANDCLPTKDYLEERNRPKNLVFFAFRLLAAMLNVEHNALDRSASGASYMVAENSLQNAYSLLVAPQLAEAKRWYGIKQSKVQRNEKNEPIMTDTLKRNVVKGILKKGLGLSFVDVPGKKSNNEFVRPHEFSPELYREVHATYGKVPKC